MRASLSFVCAVVRWCGQLLLTARHAPFALTFLLPRTHNRTGAVTSDAAVRLYAHLGSDAALGSEAWNEIVNEVDGISLSDGRDLKNARNGILTRDEWMAWITRLRDTSCTPFEIHEMHEELVGIVLDLQRATAIASKASRKAAKKASIKDARERGKFGESLHNGLEGEFDERNASVACCAGGDASSRSGCATQ